MCCRYWWLVSGPTFLKKGYLSVAFLLSSDRIQPSNQWASLWKSHHIYVCSAFDIVIGCAHYFVAHHLLSQAASTHFCFNLLQCTFKIKKANLDHFSTTHCLLLLAWFVDLDSQGCSPGWVLSYVELLCRCHTAARALLKLFDLFLSCVKLKQQGCELL